MPEWDFAIEGADRFLVRRDGVRDHIDLPAGGFDGYEPLIVEIVKFFKTGKSPVDKAETLEIFAFMEAADESKRNGGCPVSIASVMEKAQQAVDADP